MNKRKAIISARQRFDKKREVTPMIRSRQLPKALIVLMIGALTACTASNSGDRERLQQAALLLSTCQAGTPPATVSRTGYPLLASINVGKKTYDTPAYQAALSKFDLIILDFYKGWNGGSSAIRSAVQAIKALNPAIRIGQYSIINEAYDYPNPPTDEVRGKLTAENWWARTAAGAKVQWTTRYQAYDINVTDYTTADASGNRYPQWLANWVYTTFFQPVPEFDIWYFDNVFTGPRVTADYDLDGVDEPTSDSTIRQKYREAMAAHWEAARTVRSGILCVGNVSDCSSTEYTGKLDGGLLEKIMGGADSFEATAGWVAIAQRYAAIQTQVRDSSLVIFNVHGNPCDYRLLRYSLATCLLGNGHYSFTDSSQGYSSVVWFDEYGASLGQPVDAAPSGPWSNGVYRRRYDNGMVLVNPRGNGRATVTIETGYRRLLGAQAPAVNNGQPAVTITLDDSDGLILVK